jgi:very-short-patch-repair endonuclease
MIRNPGDWSVEVLFDRLGAFTCSRDRFARILEATLHPLARRGHSQTRLAEQLNAVLRRDGFQLEIAGEESGYPVYRFAAINRVVPGTPKNLIFASTGPKPEIGLRDAINNDIVILSNAESCLIYERPLRADGLLWSELVEWFAAGEGREAADPARALGQRLRASLASDAERTLFDCFFKHYRPRLGARLPALVPQVYLHYDPAVVRRLRHRPGLPRQRMDFLLLLPSRARVVLEVDGSHHFSRDGMPSLEAYSGMAAADRDLRLAGYEVYRFGANELVGQNAMERIRDFFDRLLSQHGIELRTTAKRDSPDMSAP